jgi:hypothetical protein
MKDNNEFKEIKKDFAKGTREAIKQTFKTTNGTIDGLTTGILCSLCFNMMKYNFLPLATILTCLACEYKIVHPITLFIFKHLRNLKNKNDDF